MTRDPRLARLVRDAMLLAVMALALPGTALAVSEPPATTAEPTPEPPAAASILIVNFDTQGTDDRSDDTLLDGAEFEVYADDGDGVYRPGEETLVHGPVPAPGGMIDTADLPAGRYWIAQSTFPAGFMGAAPILVELNLDPSVSCVWTSVGLKECALNSQGAEHLSWTIAMIDNERLPDPVETTAPTDDPATAAPTGGVAGATGTPAAPAITLPPSDVAGASNAADDQGGRMAAATLLAVALAALLLALRPVRDRRLLTRRSLLHGGRVDR